MTFNSFLYLVVGGAFGTLLRAASYFLIPSTSFPWPTLVVNVVGCFLMGIGYSLIGDAPNNPLRWLILVGFLGAFTTFSTFGLDMMKLIQGKQYSQFVGYFFLNNSLGLAAIFTGLSITK